MTKDEIRAQVAQTKKFQPLETDYVGSQRFVSQGKHTFQTLEKMSAEVIKKIQGLELFQKAKTVGAYMPLPDEVDITPLFQCLEKTFYIPAFDETIGSYRLAQLTDKLKPGKFGIPEPEEPVFAPEKIDLILVPGVAFDRAGHRLGRGGGFYDRLLPQYHAVRVGVCFDFQCLPVLIDEGVEVEEIPVEPHDCNIDLLVTESQILKFAKNSLDKRAAQGYSPFIENKTLKRRNSHE